MRLNNLGRPRSSDSLPRYREGYFLYFCEGYKPVFLEAVIVEPYQGHRLRPRAWRTDGKEACLLTGIQVLRRESHQAR